MTILFILLVYKGVKLILNRLNVTGLTANLTIEGTTVSCPHTLDISTGDYVAMYVLGRETSLLHLFQMPSRLDTFGHNIAFGYPAMEHGGGGQSGTRRITTRVLPVQSPAL